MQIRIVSIAQKMPTWVDAACSDYQRRLPPEMKLELFNLPLARRKARESGSALQQRESKTILQKLDDRDLSIALSERGQLWSSEDWSNQLALWRQQHPRVNLLIGGPDGLSEECLQACRHQVSLGRITLPHALVRVVVCEQLYRALTILQGHPYHRE